MVEKMTTERDITQNVIKAFKNITKEIEEGSVEHDIRPRFVKYFIEPVLCYSGSNYRYEKKRTDITIFDENNFAIIKIETKKPSENIEKPEHEEQAFKYEEETTRFICLTNFSKFKLWEVNRNIKELKINLDFSRILEQKEPLESLTAEEKSQILFLNNLSKESLFNPSKYEKFDENYARIDITKEIGFKKLLERLNFIANNMLLGYTLKAFGEYKEGYNRYLAESINAEKESKKNNGNHELNHNIAKYRQKLEEKYKRYITFSGYDLWKQYSGKEDIPDDEIKEIFCKETIYVLLDKLIFIRICEDKGLLKKNISNGGIEEVRAFLEKRFGVDKDVINKEILEMAFKSASGLYSHFYDVGILDWFRTGDGELNELLNKVLWTLNQFDFTHVDRDILGNLYEKYLPGTERKKLGEFYTPTEVIDYILTSVGYTYSYDIETRDLLDPACGSGGFLVRASRRLISRYLMKFGKTDKKELRDPKNWKEIVDRLSPDEAKIILEAAQEHIYGLDINPFACHIAEMNLLFQIIDLYQKVRSKHKDYKLKRFRIYRTDSLEKPAQKQVWDYSHAAFLEEQEEIDAIKNKKFDFVVGNPPYVRQEKIGTEYKDKSLKKEYSDVFEGRADLYVYFIRRGINWLNAHGTLGYITSNKFINANYGKRLRGVLIKEVNINAIIDFGDIKIFKDARNYTCIITFSKVKSADNDVKVITVKNEIVNLDKPLLHIYTKYKNKEYSDEYLQIYEIKQDDLTYDKWSLSPQTLLKAKNRISLASKIKLKDCCDNFAGMRTGLNDAFIVDSNVIKAKRLESTICKKCLRGKDVKKFQTLFRDKYVLYTNGLNLDDYANSKAHISDFKTQLSDRAQFKQRTDLQWYEIEQPVSREIFESTKIITPSISDTNNFTLDQEGYYCLDSCYLIVIKDNFKEKINYSYLLGLLNSRLLEFYLKQISPFVRGGWYTYKKQYTDALPIKLPETAEEKKIANQIIKKVDEIMELHKSGIVAIDAVLEGEETEKLCNLPKVTFSIKDDAKFEKVKTEDSKIYVNSQDVIDIKDKKIRDFIEIYLSSNSEKLSKSKDAKSAILNLPVPKSDEILKEIIKKGGTDHTRIKEKIRMLEEEINDTVYELYRITKEERKNINQNIG